MQQSEKGINDDNKWLVIGDDECAYVYDRASLHNVHKIDTSMLECGDIKLICEQCNNVGHNKIVN